MRAPCPGGGNLLEDFTIRVEMPKAEAKREPSQHRGPPADNETRWPTAATLVENITDS